MPLRCSCGALLPEDARFCHKCGRPQYEEDLARLNAAEEPVTVAPPPVAAAPQPPVPIGFRNARAIRITLAASAISFVALSAIATFAPPLIFPVLFGSGFGVARLYQSRTGENITARGGAALGAMTWLWLFLVEAVSTVLGLLTNQGREMIKVAMSKRPEMAALLDDPQKLLVIVGGAMVLALFIGTLSAAFGGFVAVRMQPRNGASL